MKIKLIHLFSCSLLSAVLAVGLYHIFYKPDTVIIREEAKYTLVSSEDDVKPEFSGIALQSLESVVFVRSINKVETEYNREFKSITGSGVITSSDGYIVTNHHLLEGAEYIEVTLHDKRVFKAKVIGFDTHTDLAILKIDEQGLHSLAFGDSDTLSIGDWVLAIGNPYRLNATVTAGIVSAKARHLDLNDQFGVESYIQTDAVINPGNSGGALVNTFGELIGINTAILSNSGNYEGFSFAIPSNIVQKVIQDIKEYGSVQRAWLGAAIAAVDHDIAQSLGMSKIEGVILKTIHKGGAAFSKLTKGDVITKMNGIPVNTPAEFNGILARFRPGEYVAIDYIRNKKSYHADIILQNHLNTTDLISVRKDKVLQELGIEIRNLSFEEMGLYGRRGIKVISVKKGSPASLANLEPDYIITSINSFPVEDPAVLVNKLEGDISTISFDGFYPDFPGRFPYRIVR